MRTHLASPALMLLSLVIGSAAVAEEAPAGATPAPATAEDAGSVADYHFRLGFSGFSTFDKYGDDGAAMKIGAAVVLPHLDVIVKYGLGFRLGFMVHYHQAEGGSIGSTGQRAGVDISYYEEWENADTEKTTRVPGYIFSYGMQIAFKYEVTVPTSSPSYRFFKWVQPYVGIGAVIAWTRTHTDLPKEDHVLIDNEAYYGADPDAEYDPWSIQLGPAFDLFGGMHFNVAEKFRINVELGYYLADVPGGEDEGHLKYSTDGHNAHHLAYKVNDFNLGGGVEFLF